MLIQRNVSRRLFKGIQGKSEEIKINWKNLKEVKSDQRKSKGNQRKSWPPRPPRKGAWLLKPALGHPGYAPGYAVPVSRRLFKGIHRKSKEITRIWGKSHKIWGNPKEIKGNQRKSWPPRTPSKRVWLLRPALGHPGYAPGYEPTVSRRLLKGIQRKSKEIKRNYRKLKDIK
jgi:hypothetical protein